MTIQVNSQILEWKNSDLLQEAEVENADAGLATDGGKINERNDNMNIPMEEERNSVQYQETYKLYVKNIIKTKKLNIMEINRWSYWFSIVLRNWYFHKLF